MTEPEHIRLEAEEVPLAYRARLAALFMSDYKDAGMAIECFPHRFNLFVVSRVPGREMTRGRIADNQLHQALEATDPNVFAGHLLAIRDINRDFLRTLVASDSNS